MSCYHPIKAFRTPDGVVFSALRRHDILGDIELPCGQCIGCRTRRARDWTVRCMHEAQIWKDNCFVTLTYSEENLPENGSLVHRDFQLFMKRLRVKSEGLIRFFMCGEYGGETARPHYHALLFNRDFRDRRLAGKSGSGQKFYQSDVLDSVWKLGHASVQDVNPTTAGYCTRYCMDKVVGDLADEHYGGRLPEYCVASTQLGAAWFWRYGQDAARRDYCILDGRSVPVPRYYDKLADRQDFAFLDAIEFERQKAAKRAFADNTDERRQVREEVHKARVRHQRREL